MFCKLNGEINSWTWVRLTQLWRWLNGTDESNVSSFIPLWLTCYVRWFIVFPSVIINGSSWWHFIINDDLFSRINDSVVKQLVMLFFFYSLIDVLIAGIMAILFCGVVMSHYTHLNLSPICQITVQQTFRTVAFMAGWYTSISILSPLSTSSHNIMPDIFYCITIQASRASTYIAYQSCDLYLENQMAVISLMTFSYELDFKSPHWRTLIEWNLKAPDGFMTVSFKYRPRFDYKLVLSKSLTSEWLGFVNWSDLPFHQAWHHCITIQLLF